MGFRAQVVNGRIVLNEPTELPDGTELELVVADTGDDLDAEERELLHDSLREGFEQYKRGEYVSAEEVLEQLRARRA